MVSICGDLASSAETQQPLVYSDVFAPMDVGSTNGPRSMVTQRTPSGLGFMYFHFNDRTPLDEILYVCHAITLSHMKPGQTDGMLPGTSGQVLDALRQTGTWWPSKKTEHVFDALRLTGSGPAQRWWPWREYIAVYLAFRTTSHTGFSFATSWYVSEVKNIVKYIVHLRGVVFQHRVLLSGAGCVCASCRLEWLAQGWVCPRARFVTRTHGRF